MTRWEKNQWVKRDLNNLALAKTTDGSVPNSTSVPLIKIELIKWPLELKLVEVGHEHEYKYEALVRNNFRINMIVERATCPNRIVSFSVERI